MVGCVSFDRPERCTGALSCRRCCMNTFLTYCTYFDYCFLYFFFPFPLRIAFSLLFPFTLTISPFFLLFTVSLFRYIFPTCRFFCLFRLHHRDPRSITGAHLFPLRLRTYLPTNQPSTVGAWHWILAHPFAIAPTMTPTGVMFRPPPTTTPSRTSPRPLPSRHAQCKRFLIHARSRSMLLDLI